MADNRTLEEALERLDVATATLSKADRLLDEAYEALSESLRANFDAIEGLDLIGTGVKRLCDLATHIESKLDAGEAA